MIFGAAVALAACTSVVEPPTTVTSPDAIERGARIAAAQCASCHSIDATSQSRHPLARPLRKLAPTLGAHDMAFAIGAHVGWGDMPNFKLNHDDFNDLMAYVGTIRTEK
jgi:mono/diheme cytochrome c family protein